MTEESKKDNIAAEPEAEAKKTVSNVFRNRNYRLVFFGALVSELGAVLYSFAVSFYILEISGNNTFLQGVYLALCSVTYLLFTPIGGVLGDRFNRGMIMFVCDYVKGGLILSAILFMILFPQNGAHIWILFIIGILGNAVSGIFSPAAGALLPNIVEEDQLQQGNAYFTVRGSFQNIFGVILAGILYAAMPITWLFLVVGICYVLSGVSEMFIRYEHVRPKEQLTVRVALLDMKDGIRYLKEQKAIVAMLAAILFINFFFHPIGGNFIPYFVKTDIAEAPSYLFDKVLTPELWSSVISVLFGVSSLIGAVLLSAKKQEDKVGLKTALRLLIVALAMVVLTFSYWLLVERGVSLNVFLIVFCGCCLLIGFMISCINIPINTVLMRVVERDKLSKVTSIISILSQGLVPIASVLAGTVLQYLGSTVLLLVCSIGFTAASLMLLFNKNAREI